MGLFLVVVVVLVVNNCRVSFKLLIYMRKLRSSLDIRRYVLMIHSYVQAYLGMWPIDAVINASLAEFNQKNKEKPKCIERNQIYFGLICIMFRFPVTFCSFDLNFDHLILFWYPWSGDAVKFECNIFK